MIFAREVSDNLTSLVKKIDACTAKNKDAKMGSFVVFLSDDENMEKKLKELAKKNKIDNTILTIVEKKDGPEGYDIDKDADITVVLYVKKTVKANYPFKKGQMKEKDITKIVGDLKKILPEKE
jgi:hypothetical protein